MANHPIVYLYNVVLPVWNVKLASFSVLQQISGNFPEDECNVIIKPRSDTVQLHSVQDRVELRERLPKVFSSKEPIKGP